MKIVSACIYVLNIPFVESFSHSLYERNHSDSIIVKLTANCGVSGFGEGVPRPYVTGETQEDSIRHIRDTLLPRVLPADLDAGDGGHILPRVNELLPEQNRDKGVVWNASRCAVELALIDCYCRVRNFSVAEALPPNAPAVTYSGVITTGSPDKVARAAEKCKKAGLTHIKIKVSSPEAVESIAVVRSIVGAFVSIRLDANGAFDRDTALLFLASAAKYNVECIEQPIPRGNVAELAALRADSPISVMADESLITLEDARELIDKRAADYFNLRISKCGGLQRTLAIAELARSAGVGIQLGCQVGETAILSAAGRHMAAHLGNLRFVEGSYGKHLLLEDISKEDIVFGLGGRAPILPGIGLGVTIRDDLLEKYAVTKIPVC